MGLFRFWKGPDINQGLKQFEETPGAVLLDVRSPGEYRQGCLPGSQNLPLQAIDRIGQLAALRCLFIATAAPEAARRPCG